jgi:hypothetical protein
MISSKLSDAASLFAAPQAASTKEARTSRLASGNSFFIYSSKRKKIVGNY